MIRRTDAIERTPHPGRIKREPSLPRPSAAPGGVRPVAPSVNRTAVERTLGDAFSLAQMSQNIIQRAMAISFQLKSIAASAIASGRINTQELATTLSEMRSAFARYGEEVAAPAQATVQSSVKIPDINEEIQSLHEISAGFQEGRFDRFAAIEGVINRLGDKLAASATAGDAIAALMKGKGIAGQLEQPVHPGTLVARVTEKIVSSPASALAAQGNINYMAADRLMA